MRISIIQSCYIPWKGFFDLIGQCDEYVIFDSVQYAKRHWHNRNRIKTPSGVQWMTIPVVTKGRFDQPIDAVEIADSWAEKHWRTLTTAYGRSPQFHTYCAEIEKLYEQAEKSRFLTEVNEIFLRGLSSMLDLTTRITRDTAYPSDGRKTKRLLSIAQAAGADRYLSGPSARDYLDESQFAAAGIATEWMTYSGYPEYAQMYGPFEHAVSVLDVLFHAGREAPRFTFGDAGYGLQTVSG